MESISSPFRGIVSVLYNPKFIYGNRICYLRGVAAVMMFLVQSQLFFTVLALPQVVTAITDCAVRTHGPLNRDWVVTAPARFVPAPPVDPAIQREFYKLFLSHDNFTKDSVRNEPLPPGISQNDLDFISSVCPKSAFFYSMSPQHVLAQNLLQQYLAAQPTPSEFLRVSRIILHNHEINPKIWYYSLMGAAMERPDMSGLQIAQPLDVIPDLFVPAPILSEALSKYRPVFGVGQNYFGPSGGGVPLGAPVRGRGGGNGGGFVPSVGTRSIPISGVLGAGIKGLAPLDGLESGSYQSFSGPLGAASQLNEHIVKFSAGDKYNNGFVNFTAEEHGGDSNNLGFAKRRGMIIRKRVKVRRRSDGRVRGRTTRHLGDNAGAESVPLTTTESFQQTGAGVRRSMNLVKDGDDDEYGRGANGTNYGRKLLGYPEEHYGVTLSYGEEDDEYDELIRIHKISSNSTRDIRQRILQRRQRRKKNEKERPSTKVKRQAFGGAPLFQQQYQHPIRDCSVINGSIGALNGVENKLWYFREDLMVNQHHWYWHQMYPINATRHADRRAELFFFHHRNLVARYNAERLSNGLPRTTELILRNEAIVEDGYNAQMIDMNSRKFWTPREPHVPLTDILHEQDPDFATNIFLKEVHELYHKLIYSIKDGHLVGINNQAIPILNVQGIDNLANTVEASSISVNPQYYSSLGVHNYGHQILGLIQDPQFISQLPTGIMADTAVTMRDPVFYTFHSGIDNLFDRHKRTLPPYQLYEGEYPLVWSGVAISNVEVVSSFTDGHPNHLRSFWSTDRFPLEGGIDNSIHNGEFHEDICAVHLNHEPFTYKITVNVNPCVHTVSGQGMIRIFLAPRFDEYGHRFPLKVQRRLMLQLDSFPVQLQQGRNVILRRSEDSSLTKPWPAPLRQQSGGAIGSGGQQQGGAADFCGCGWPRHLLLPKGNLQGMPFDLFVMITNYDEDIVQNDPQDLNIPEPCTSPHLFCGVPFRKYPDARPMGYPFDRLPFKKPVHCNAATGYPDVVCKMLHPQWFKTVDTLEEYTHSIPNTATKVLVIQHLDSLIN